MIKTRSITILAMLISAGLQLDAPLWGAESSEVFHAHARVLEIISPTTLKVHLLTNKRTLTVRLQGLSPPGGPRGSFPSASGSPSRTNSVSAAALEFIKATIDGKVVELWTRKGGRWDDKNRLLACVRVRNFLDETIDVNGELLRRGLCTVSRDYLHSTFARFKLLEEDAKRARRGMWNAPDAGKISEVEKRSGNAHDR
ncbi:MAG: thermonuclease family protein [Thermodesulfobacteriota bacterium]